MKAGRGRGCGGVSWKLAGVWVVEDGGTSFLESQKVETGLTPR
jgi:hypothetical protein